MEHIDDIISQLGGVNRAAEITGRSVHAVQKWRELRRIPSLHWARIVRETNGRVTFNDLAALADKEDA